METKSIGLFLPVGKQETNALQSIQRPTVTYWQDARARLLRNKVATASGIFVLLLALVAFIVPPFLQYDYETQEVWNKHASPNAGYPALVEVSVPYVEKTATTAPVDAVVTDPPTAPQNLQLMNEPTTRQIAISWDQVPGAEGYRVYRSTSDDTLGIPLADVPVGLLSYRDLASLKAGTDYFYAVEAFNSMGDSPASSLLKVRPKLTLSLEAAQKFVPTAKPGDQITTHAHYLGTDYLGRDMLSRLLVGTRISISVGVVAPLLFVFIGVIFGAVSGYFGGLADNIMMRTADILVTIPNLLILIMLQVVMGSGAITLVIALVISDWAAVSQQVRGEVLRIRETEFVHAAHILGTSFWKIIFRHILPNVMGTILVLFSIAIPRVIFTEAFLSFIGLGIAPPLPSLGSVTREGAAVMSTYPLELLIPGVLLSVTVLAFNLFGDGMRDALDPKQRGVR